LSQEVVMEVADALRVPLAPALVREALGDLALVRASIDNCESLLRLAGGEYILAMTVPLGALRSRYVIRAHVAEARRLPRHDGPEGEVDAQTLSFKARGEGVGSLRGQIAVALIPDANGDSTWIEYTVWATLTGPLASLPPRQIENALREVADDFFAEFCEVVRAKHGHPATHAPDAAVSRRHIFLRPIAMSAAFARPASAAAQKSRAAAAEAIGGVLRHRLHVHAPRNHSHNLPAWAWAAMLGCVAVFLFLAQHYGLQ
jgi:carbon monoxide dehydrogenase subunit G